MYVGTWCAAALAAVSFVVLTVQRAVQPGAAPVVGRWVVATVAVLLIAAVTGGLVWLALSRRIGTDLDRRGVRRVVGSSRVCQPWPGIVDIRAERHGGRVEVRAYLRDGDCLRLPAPYDGRLLAHDPGFEYKYQRLRQVWESHRHRYVD